MEKDTGVQGSWQLRTKKRLSLERFEYIVDGEKLDKEDRKENNGVLIFWRALPQGESPTLGPRVCVSLKENFQLREKRNTSFIG